MLKCQVAGWKIIARDKLFFRPETPEIPQHRVAEKKLFLRFFTLLQPSRPSRVTRAIWPPNGGSVLAGAHLVSLGIAPPNTQVSTGPVVMEGLCCASKLKLAGIWAILGLFRVKGKIPFENPYLNRFLAKIRKFTHFHRFRETPTGDSILSYFGVSRRFP